MHSYVLEWYCNDNEHIQIQCSSNDDDLMTVRCNDQTLTPRFHQCLPDIITSVVEINISSNSTTWTCLNPLNPSLSESINASVEGELYIVIIVYGMTMTIFIT